MSQQLLCVGNVKKNWFIDKMYTSAYFGSKSS